MNVKKILTFLWMTMIIFGCGPRISKSTADREFLPTLLKSYPQYFDSLLRHNDQYGIQIIYTKIDRNENNQPVFSDYFFNTDNPGYFYPASTVKLPTALLALQRLHELDSVDRNTTMITEAGYGSQTEVYNDPFSAEGRPTIAQYVKKILLVSDNDAFNRLYEFLGQEYINNNLHNMGYDDVQIIHRLNIFLSEDENRHTNPVKFYSSDSTPHILFSKPLENSRLVYATRDDKKGNGYYSGDKLVNEPLNFSKKNRLALTDLHSILKAVFFPGLVKKKQQFALTKEDYEFVQRYMSMFPRESDYPMYDSSYQDAYSRFLLWGEGKEKQNGNIRIFHKSGDAYGFLTDAAYIVDFENNIEFMLSATIYCNNDGILNDDHYDYNSIGLPFMKHLGEVVYDYELKRTRKNKPDLSSVKFNY